MIREQRFLPRPFVLCSFSNFLHGVSGTILFTLLFTYVAGCVPAQRPTEGLPIFRVSGMAPMFIGAMLGDWILESGSSPGGRVPVEST